MGRGRNGKDSCYVYNDYFIHGIRLSLVQDLKENEGLPFDEILNKYNFNKALTWRWEKSIPKGNKISINKVNIAKQGDEPEWVEIPQIVIELTKKYINEKLNDEEIKKELKFKLMKEGFKMENNNLVKSENVNKEFYVVYDGGNYNQKAKYKESKLTLTSRVLIGDLADMPGLKWIKIDNKRMYIGTEEGTYVNGYDKSEKLEAIKGLFLYMIDKVINTDEQVYSVNVGYLLPISQTKKSQKIISAFENKTFEIETDNGEKIITIKSITIMPEGYCSTGLFMNDENINFMKNETLLLDMGSRTINAISLDDGEITNADTMNMGSFELYDAINEETKKTKEKSIEKIAKLYEKDKMKVSDKIHIDYLDKIKNSLITYSEDLEDYDNIVLTGGVAKLLSIKTLEDGQTTLLAKLIELLGVDKNNVHVLDNPTETNIDGAMILLEEINKVA